MEAAITEINGLGWFQIRTALCIAVPLSAAQGLWQMQVFFGQVLPHECENDINKTGSIISNYIERNISDCGDCSMHTTYTNDFGLLCDNKSIMPYLQSILLFGSVFGQTIWGALQDQIGRRKVLLICGNSLSIFLAIMVFAPNHYYYMVGSGLAGFFSSGLGAYTLPIELVSADKRFIVGTLITAGWATGAGWYLLSSFVFRNWRFAAGMTFSPVLICLCTYYFWIPESPRWLLRQGRREEAVEVLQWMAKVNKRSLNTKILETLELKEKDSIEDNKDEQNETLSDLFKNPRVLFRFLIMLTCQCQAISLWMVIILSTGKMHCCIYITMLIIFLMEGPLRLALATPILKLTRRKGLYLCGCISSFFFLGTLIIDDFGGDNMDLLKLIFGVTGKFMLTMYFPITYTYIGELHPTAFRELFSGLIRALAAAAASVVPILLFQYSGFTYHMAIQTLILFQLLLFMPATLRKTLPDSFQSASKLNKERGWKLTI